MLVVFIINFWGCVTGREIENKRERSTITSLNLHNIIYSLKTDNKFYYQNKNEIKIQFKTHNTTTAPVHYQMDKNLFIICYLKNKERKIIKKIKLPVDMFFNDNHFNLQGGEERSFPFKIHLQDEIIKNNNLLYLEIRLLFLRKQLRRNRLSIILQKKK